MTRPSIWHCDPTQYSDHTRGPGYVIVGAVEDAMHAEAHGGHVGDGETVVWVPADVIDELVAERTEELRAQLQDAREANHIMREAAARRREVRACTRSRPHPAHGWMFARKAVQCPGVTDPKEPTP